MAIWNDVSISSIVGSAAGGGTMVFLAKLYLQKAFKDLDKVVSTMHSVQKDLVAIAIRLEKIEKYDMLILEHEKKIAVLERMTSRCGTLKP